VGKETTNHHTTTTYQAREIHIGLVLNTAATRRFQPLSKCRGWVLSVSTICFNYLPLSAGRRVSFGLTLTSPVDAVLPICSTRIRVHVGNVFGGVTGNCFRHRLRWFDEPNLQSFQAAKSCTFRRRYAGASRNCRSSELDSYCVSEQQSSSVSFVVFIHCQLYIACVQPVGSHTYLCCLNK